MKASLSIPRISCATNMLLGCDPNIAGKPDHHKRYIRFWPIGWQAQEFS